MNFIEDTGEIYKLVVEEDPSLVNMETFLKGTRNWVNNKGYTEEQVIGIVKKGYGNRVYASHKGAKVARSFCKNKYGVEITLVKCVTEWKPV